jgi:chromosome segregation protein
VFRLKVLEVHHWDRWDRFRIPLDGDIVVVTGINGAGKTTLLDAIRVLLGAQKLAEDRPMANYVRGEGGSLLSAVVTNSAPKGGRRPFSGEGIETEEATIACAVVPKSGGEQFTRFYAVLPGAKDSTALRRFFFDEGGGRPVGHHRRVMQNAGVTLGYLSVLGIEQGSVGHYVRKSPEELFADVFEMMGERRVIDEFDSARRKLETCAKDTLEIQDRANKQQTQLDSLRIHVDHLDTSERIAARLDELARQEPAVELQRALAVVKESGPKVKESETKKARATGERQEAAQRNTAAGSRRRELETEASSLWKATQARLKQLLDARGARERLSGEVDRLSALRSELRDIPPEPLDGLLEDWRVATANLTRAVDARDSGRRELDDHRKRLRQLETGRIPLPMEVQKTVEELKEQGIETRLLCDLIEPISTDSADTMEAAMGDARFGLIVSSDERARAESVARSNGFPGPVFSGASIEPGRHGELLTREGAPAWLARWLEEVEILSDGGWSDYRGTWVMAAKDRYLGRSALEAQLSRVKSAVREAEARELELQSRVAGLDVTASSLWDRVERQRRREQLALEFRRLPEIERGLTGASELETSLGRDYEGLLERSGHVATELAEARERMATAEAELKAAEKDIREADQALLTTTGNLAVAQAQVDGLRATVPPDLAAKAERGEFLTKDDYADMRVRLSRQRAELGPIPDSSVRTEAQVLFENLGKTRAMLAERQDEQASLLKAVEESRGEYVKEANIALREYRDRLLSIAAQGGLSVKATVPALTNDEKSVSDAALHVSIAFDGKPLVPAGDRSLSGGQKAIAGLLIIMAMADTEGGGFFLFDEPYASLSMDRVDLVAGFLKRSGAQFVLTEPTSGDPTVLQDADLHVALEPQHPAENFAPRPRVARPRRE